MFPCPWVAADILPFQIIWDSPLSHLLQGSFTARLPFFQWVTQKSGPLTSLSPCIPTAHLVWVFVSSYPRSDLGPPTLFPAFPLCSFLAPSFSLFPHPRSWRHYSCLKGIPPPSSWALWKWDFWSTVCLPPDLPGPCLATSLLHGLQGVCTRAQMEGSRAGGRSCPTSSAAASRMLEGEQICTQMTRNQQVLSETPLAGCVGQANRWS